MLIKAREWSGDTDTICYINSDYIKLIYPKEGAGYKVLTADGCFYTITKSEFEKLKRSVNNE